MPVTRGLRCANPPYALHVVGSEPESKDPRIQTLRTEFEQRCAAAGVNGKLAVTVGDVADSVCERARWADLVVASLTRPSSPSAPTKPDTGWRTLLRRCPRPVLVVPGPFSALTRALLAYDGNPKAEEALYVATYLAKWWHVSLCILTVSENRQDAEKINAHAREYLALRQVEAEFTHAKGRASSAILRTAESQNRDLIIMGGYTKSPMLKLTLGSVVEGFLRTTRQRVLICQ